MARGRAAASSRAEPEECGVKLDQTGAIGSLLSTRKALVHPRAYPQL